MDWTKQQRFIVRLVLHKRTTTLLFVHVEVEAEILDSNLDEAQLQRLRNGERPGALWHLFRADDAKKIRDYLDRVGLSV